MSNMLFLCLWFLQWNRRNKTYALIACVDLKGASKLQMDGRRTGSRVSGRVLFKKIIISKILKGDTI